MNNPDFESFGSFGRVCKFESFERFESFDKFESFENKVLKGLADCGVSLKSECRVGAAVSGGADSISLLYSLARIFRQFSKKIGRPFPLEVITVNHYMRPKEETCGDVAFVVDCCERLRCNGYDVNCTVVELEPGAIVETARVRQAGSEEAARFLRYGAFDNFIKDKNLDFLCLAHNKNDNFETILMRFLQGSSVDAGGGILSRRGAFVRPLLCIYRCEIEEYLKGLEVGWCNDKTNDDTNYLRNNIRHNLIPFLNDNFAGWEKAVAAGAEKASEDADVIKEIVDSFNIEIGHNCVSFSKGDFLDVLPGVQKRILIKACNLAGESCRISNTFLNDVINGVSNCSDNEFSKIYNNIEINVKKDLVFVKKYIKKDTDLVFFDIIDDDGVYDFPFGKLSVTFSDSAVFSSINGCDAVFKGNSPICVRNAQLGDEILCSSGKMKKVADIYSDWHVPNSDKKLIPVISCSENGFENLKCILGGFLGYKDWIVK